MVSLLFSNRLPQVLAHRGASGHAPETTLAAFRLALQMKADFLELDVQMSRDGEIVAIHDSSLDRTTNNKGPVAEKTLAQLRELDAGSWFNRAFPAKARPEYVGQRIPTLQEIIDLAKESPVSFYIETKSPELYPAEFEARLLDLLRRNRVHNRTIIQSFSAHSLEKVKALDPSIPTALLVETPEPDPVEAAARSGADELAIDYRLLNPEVAEKARNRGLTIAVWTVNEDEDLRRMIRLGVDRIITNYPDRLNRLLGR
jgi:glycerophosphoryl diester phosphodiesterase